MAPILVSYLYSKAPVMRFSILIFLTVIMGSSGCSSQKKLVAEAPFELGNPSCTPVIEGREESGMGYKLEIPINRESARGVVFSEVYFRGKVLPSEAHVQGDTYIISCSYREGKGKPDMVMSSDPYAEVGNQPPRLKDKDQEEFPFTLNPDEAVLSYVLPNSEKVYYIKIEGITEKPARVRPSKPSQ